jgi:hypothetical protein
VNRAGLAANLGARLGAYLTATTRTASDAGAGTLTPAIDDALRALGIAYADLATATADDDETTDDWIVQGTYRALLQIKRDLGATFFDVTVGDSFNLSQVRAAAEKDLADAETAVLDRFRTLGVVSGDGGAVWSLDLNHLVPRCEVLA